MKRILIAILILLNTSFLFSDQTFESISATPNNIFYGVPVQIKIVEHNLPTDFYISIGNGSTWTQLSNTFGWGNEFSPSGTFNWTPDSIYNNVHFGIHTGNRNSETFTSLPTDFSDNTFTINRSSITFNPIDSIWLNDVFYISWNSNESELPENILLEYKLNSSNSWTEIGNIKKSDNSINFSNYNINEDVTFRLTYYGSEYGYELGSVSSTFYPSILNIVNQQEIENNIWGDNQEIEINLEKINISEYNFIKVYIDNILIDSIEYNRNSLTYTTSKNKDEHKILEFYDKSGNLLNALNIYSENKYFEISPLNNANYKQYEIVEFNWSYSNHFDKVKVELIRNSSTISEILHYNWNLTDKYNYRIQENDTNLTFKFFVDDNITFYDKDVSDIKIVDHCKENELYYIIDSLLIDISKLNGLVDSLSNIENDTIIISIIKDIPLNVEDEKLYSLKEMENLQVINNTIQIPNDNISHIMIYNILGQIVLEQSGIEINNPINIENLDSGIFVLYLFDFSNNVHIYRFLK